MKEKKTFTVEEISTEMDVVFLEWCLEREPSGDL